MSPGWLKVLVTGCTLLALRTDAFSEALSGPIALKSPENLRPLPPLKTESTASRTTNTLTLVPVSIDPPLCIISASEAETLAKYLAGFKQVFTGGSLSATPPGGIYHDDTEFEDNCGIHIANLRNTLWRILNQVWMAASCQYHDETTRAAAFNQIELERTFVLDILQNIYIQGAADNNVIAMRSWENGDIDATLQSAVDTVKRLQCSPFDIKQVSGTLQAVLREMALQIEAVETQKRLNHITIKELEDQKRQTLEALKAAQCQRERVEVGLYELSLLKAEAQAAIITELEWNGRQDGRILEMEQEILMMRLTSGKYFNLESKAYGGEYVCLNANPPEGTFLNAYTIPASLAERKEDRCLWQLVPVPPNPDGEWFYLRNKMDAVQPIPRIQNENYVHVLPEISVIPEGPRGINYNQIFVHFEFLQDTSTYYLVPTGNVTEFGRRIFGSPQPYDYSRWIPRFPSWYFG